MKGKERKVRKCKKNYEKVNLTHVCQSFRKRRGRTEQRQQLKTYQEAIKDTQIKGEISSYGRRQCFKDVSPPLNDLWIHKIPIKTPISLWVNLTG